MYLVSCFWKWVLVLNPNTSTLIAFSDSFRALLSRNRDFLVEFVGNSERGSFRPNRSQFRLLEVGARSRVFLHVFLQPLGKLFFRPEPETDSFRRVGFETRVDIVAGLSRVFRARVESRGLRHAVDQYGFLQGRRTLFVIDFCISKKLLSPKFLETSPILGSFKVYRDFCRVLSMLLSVMFFSIMLLSTMLSFIPFDWLRAPYFFAFSRSDN